MTCCPLQLSVTKPGLSGKLAPPKKETKITKGVQSAAVKAFLEKKEKEDKDKGEYFICVNEWLLLILFVLVLHCNSMQFLLSSALCHRISMSSAIQWQHHQLIAVTAAHPPAWSVTSC